MKYLSICSGIEAATVAWHGFGWEPVGFAEIEPFPAAVLKHHYPEVPNLGDMTKYKEWQADAFDVLVGGTPCQAFSVAGLRQSLDDARGNLSLVFCEMADHFDPPYILWENVPGVLNTKDNAFGCFLAGLAGEDVPLVAPGGKWSNAGFVLGPKRNVAWRVLDAQYFGLAQRRRRVFVVACPRDGADPCEILFEREGVQRHSAPSREKGEGASATLESRSRAGGFPGTDGACGGHVAPCNHEAPIAFHPTQDPIHSEDGSCHALGCGSKGGTATHAVAFAQNQLGEVRTGRGQPVIAIQERAICENPLAGPDGAGVRTDDCAYTLEARTVPQAVAFEPRCARNGRGQPIVCQEVVGALACNTGPNGHDAGNFTSNQGVDGGYIQPVAFNVFGGNKRKDRPEGGFYVEENPDATKALDATGGLNKTCSQGGVCVAFDAQNAAAIIDGTCGTLQRDPGGPGGSSCGFAVQTGMQVRRLTPVECERLQGFPDGYTAIPWRNKPASECPDGPRYKALGNSMAVPCMRWIGWRIMKTGI